MKFMKKAAALFFCLALALSVMAITALADDNPGFVVQLEETTSNQGSDYTKDVNGTNGNEYSAGNTIVYKVNLAASKAVTVDAFQFQVVFGGDDASILSVNSVEVDTNIFPEDNANSNSENLYAYAKSADANSTGFSVTTGYATIATITLKVADNATHDQKATFNVANFNAKYHDTGLSYNATCPQNATPIEVDPHYSITVMKPALKDNGAINYGDTNNPTYSETATGASEGYNILAGGNVTAPALNAYYTFKEYVVVSGSGWTAGEKYDNAALNTQLGNHTHWGDLVLNAVYEANVYHVTVNRPNESATNGTLAFESPSAVDNPTTYTTYTSDQLAAANITQTQYIPYTIEGKSSAARFADADKIQIAATKTAYSFVKYAESATTEGTAPGGGWGDIVASSFSNNEYAIAEGLYGDVTLTAMYQPISYTVTYNYGHSNASMTVAGTKYTNASETPYTIVYNINTASTKTFAPATPARPGYKFEGWLATGAAGATIGKVGNDGAEWPTTTAATSIAGTGKYGNVTLTAQWVIDGKFAQAPYSYATTDNNLILFAYEGETAPPNGKYTYTDGSLSGDMYKVPTEKYKSVFSGEGNNAALDAGKSYVIFAFIAPATTAEIGNVAFADETGASNEAIQYNGRLDSATTGIPDSADYGNVVAMLADKSYGNSALTVKARLEADVTLSAENADQPTDDEYTAECVANFGGINDVIKIMKKALNISG